MERTVWGSGRGINHIEEQIDQNAGGRDVHPDRKGPAGDPTVALEIPPPGADQRDRRQKRNRCGEEGVADQNGKIDRPNPSPAREGDRADVVVIDQIGGQEKDGYNKCAEHEPHMDADVFFPDLEVTRDQQNAAQRVQAGVEGGQDFQYVQSRFISRAN